MRTLKFNIILFLLTMMLGISGVFTGYYLYPLKNKSDYQLQVNQSGILIVDGAREVSFISFADSCKLTETILKDNK